MLDSKLLQLCRSLTKKELNGFKDYVASPYFNKSERVLLLAKYILRYAPTFESYLLKRERVAAKLIKNEVLTDSALRSLMAKLGRLLEEYIAQLEFDSDMLLQERLFLEGLKNHRLPTIFERHFSKARKQHKNSENINVLYHQMALEEINYQNDIITRNRDLNSNLPDLLHRSDVYVTANKLRYALVTINRKNIIRESLDVPLVNSLLKYLDTDEAAKVKETPLVFCYYHLCNMFNNVSKDNEQVILEKHFLTLKDWLHLNGEKLAKDEQRQIYIALTNYCTPLINAGYLYYLEHMFHFYNEMIERDLLLVNGRFMIHQNYKNIVTVALRLKKYDWVDDFIENFKEKVDADFRSDVYHYSKAALAFALEQYDATLGYLHEVGQLDGFYYVSKKVLLTKTYYELEQSGLLHSSIEALRMYVQRSKLFSDYHTQSYKQFINLLKKLVRHQMSKDQLLKAAEEIEGSEYLIERIWLQKKVEDAIENI